MRRSSARCSGRNDAGARVLVTERALADRAAGLRRACEALEHVVGVDGSAPGVTALEDVAAEPAIAFEATWAAIRPDDVLTLMYTSGTTGAPKGAAYTHGAMAQVGACLDASLPPLDDVRGVAFIPFAHAGQRAAGHYFGMVRASTTTFCADPMLLPAVVAEARPTSLLAPPGLWARLAAGLADGATLARLGLDRLVQPIVTGAPSPPGLLERLHSVGVPVMNMYALTEVPPVAITTTDPADIGTAGAPLRGVEVRLADDGEILVRHPGASSGYHGRPAQSAALFDPDGWAHTGDLGRVDDKGRLTITGRRDEQIVTSLGTNIDPVAVEQAVILECPQIAHACVIGHGREHLVALINVPEAEDATVAAAVERVNERLPETGRIRRFCVLREPWRPGGGEMTPTMKLRRKAIHSRYADEIAAMYRPVQTV